MRPQYTPTQLRILDMLSDGFWHSKTELISLLNDEMTSAATLSMHILLLRKRLPPGEAIVCEAVKGMKTGYRHVRLLTSPVDGTN